VAIVDAPLDMARLWGTERRAENLGFHPAAADEGRWVTYLLETHLGGTPTTASPQYVEFSPFSHGAPDGGNAVYLRTLPIRAYHEPDVDWWIENRRKSYYDMNSIDLAALINQLRILGNDSAALVSSHQRRAGYDEGATPHTWSIVDNQELVEWFLSLALPTARLNGLGSSGRASLQPSVIRRSRSTPRTDSLRTHWARTPMGAGARLRMIPGRWDSTRIPSRSCEPTPPAM
jgi:hypothetical protein